MAQRKGLLVLLIICAAATAHGQKFTGKCLDHNGWLKIEKQECAKVMSILATRDMPLRESGVKCGHGGMTSYDTRGCSDNCNCLGKLISALSDVTDGSPVWGRLKWKCIDHDDFGLEQGHCNDDDVAVVNSWLVASSNTGEKCSKNDDCWNSGVCRGGHCCDKTSFLSGPNAKGKCTLCDTEGECTSSTSTPTTTSVTTITTSSTTTNTDFAALQGDVSDIEKLLEAQIQKTEKHVEKMQGQISNLIELVEQFAAGKKADQARISDLEDMLANKLNKPSPQPAAGPLPTACAKDGSDCAPSVSATEDGKLLGLNSCCGSVVINSADCTVNPCDLLNDLNAVKNAIGL